MTQRIRSAHRVLLAYLDRHDSIQQGRYDGRGLDGLDTLPDIAGNAILAHSHNPGSNSMESHTRDDAAQMAGEEGTFWFDQGQQAAEAKLKQASVLAAAFGLLDALYFYADPESYLAVAVLADRPAGEFADDEAALSEDDKGYYHDYREGGTYPGKKARAALAAWRKATAD